MNIIKRKKGKVGRPKKHITELKNKYGLKAYDNLGNPLENFKVLNSGDMVFDKFPKSKDILERTVTPELAHIFMKDATKTAESMMNDDKPSFIKTVIVNTEEDEEYRTRRSVHINEASKKVKENILDRIENLNLHQVKHVALCYMKALLRDSKNYITKEKVIVPLYKGRYSDSITDQMFTHAMMCSETMKQSLSLSMVLKAQEDQEAICKGFLKMYLYSRVMGQSTYQSQIERLQKDPGNTLFEAFYNETTNIISKAELITDEPLEIEEDDIKLLEQGVMND